LLFVNLTSSKPQDCGVRIFLGGFNRNPVYVQKCKRDYERSSLIAVDEGVVRGDAEGIRSGEP